MTAAVRYYLLVLVLLPIAPILYWQGRRVRKRVPHLPEALAPNGVAGASGTPLRLLVLGESTMAGVGVDRHENGFAGALARRLAESLNQTVTWRVVARSGYTVRQVREKLLTEVSGEAPDVIVVGIGGNDAFQLTNPFVWQTQVRQLIIDLRDRFPKTPILFTAVPPIREFPAFPWLMQRILGGLVEMLGTTLQQECQYHDLVYCPKSHVRVNEWVGRSEGALSAADFFSDGVHPAPITYRLWGQIVAEDVLAEGLY